MDEAATRRAKRRDAGATRSRILESARRVFTEKGYEAAGLREICGNAGVDQALIKRYFGSKKKLFEEIFDKNAGIHDRLLGPREAIGREIAAYYLDKTRRTDQFDATTALLHSMGSRDVNDHLKRIIETQFIDRLAAHIGGAQSQQRAALIIAQILGFDVVRRLLGVEALSKRHEGEVAAIWARQIQTLVDGEPPG